MNDMYSAMINSPVTTLTSNITSTDTTITVSDITKLPTAPNLATIGSDETCETILYTGISGNNLTGVTRGFQGIAKVWNSGTSISRTFTAYDNDTFITNIIEAYEKVKDQNTSTGVGGIKFWTGTQAEYDAIPTKDNSIIYIVR